MKKGRITKEEQVKRFKALCRFIFTFRYATRKQLDAFSRLVIGLKYPQWLVDFSVRQGLLTSYPEPVLRCKIYHLTQKAKNLIKNEEPRVSHYHFEKRHAGINTFNHHNLLVESFFLLQKHLQIREWVCEWVLRINKHKKDKIPDSVLILLDGTRISLEAETSYKSKNEWETVVTLYRYDIEKAAKYDAVLIVAQDMRTYESIACKLYKIAPVFCSKHFILTEPGMLEQNLCFYQEGIRNLTLVLMVLKNQMERKNGTGS